MANNVAKDSDFGSCDTFVCFPPHTINDTVIFGKNSDRPSGEVQEIVYFPENRYNEGTKLKCTYIEIDQAPETAAVILSKPSWMWGAEMGANHYGICIGNEAVWTKMMSLDYDLKERLLGMDLVRLGLERSKTALEGLNIITGLLEKYGQGGLCSDSIKDFTYHNSFLIVDKNEAWVLETAGQFWAAERITSGFRNISNCLSIGCKIDLESEGLQEKAKSLGVWKESDGKFNFATVFGNDPVSGTGQERLSNGRELLRKYSENNNFDVKCMMDILRDVDCGICRIDSHAFPTTSSQISILSREEKHPSSCHSHWFTGTPNPSKSLFKPFLFSMDAHFRNNYKLTIKTASPQINEPEDPAKCIPRFQKTVDRRHCLLKAHENL